MNGLKHLPKNGSVGVVGGGISGLFFTYFLNLKRPDLKITILDKSSSKEKRVGGWIHTHVDTKSNLKLEKGPRTLRGVSPGTSLILQSLIKMNPDVRDHIMYIEKESVANRKFIVDPKDHKKLVQVPPITKESFLKFMKSGASEGFFRSLIYEYFNKSKNVVERDESIYDFMKRRFGNDKLVSNLASALFFGIYATDVKDLSANYCIPRLVNYEKSHGGIFRGLFSKNQPKVKTNGEDVSDFATFLNIDEKSMLEYYNELKKIPLIAFKDGMSTMPNKVRDYLQTIPNISFKFDYDVDRIDVDNNSLTVNNDICFDHVHLSTVSDNFTLNNDRFMEYNKSLGRGTNVLLINVYHPKKNLIHPDIGAFGFLVPKNCHTNLLGCIFDSVIEKNMKNFYNQRLLIDSDSLSNGNYTKMTMMVSYNGKEIKDINKNDCMENAVYKMFENQLGLSKDQVTSLKKDKDLLVEFTFADNSIPIYSPGKGFHSDMKRDIRTILKEDLLKNNNISVGGFKFADGPGMPDVVVESLRAVKRLTE
ncbi:uncharacterized protein HGUI_02785 [Hanseniaspora guilliermondii]|uniref:Protoporphyrinogen oxidase n=1 Tax=Hanseniaspora guilliermondii TaxID=56406 RepID=A0A1L0CQ37_9ASCO|nr:uncharacterized protein HGUI_02785 [Hanseniaspora guilliermondii]